MEGGGRWDGGDAAGGGGLELGLSLSHRRPGIGLEVRADGRYTVLHQAETFEDRSLSLAVSLDPGVAGKGLRLSLEPSWGNLGGGALHWMAADTAGVMAPGLGIPGMGAPGLGTQGEPERAGWRPSRYEATLGYGWSEHSTREVYSTLTENGWEGRQLRVGGRTTLGGRLGLRMDLELVRSQRDGAAPEYGVVLRIGSGARVRGDSPARSAVDNPPAEFAPSTPRIRSVGSLKDALPEAPGNEMHNGGEPLVADRPQPVGPASRTADAMPRASGRPAPTPAVAPDRPGGPEEFEGEMATPSYGLGTLSEAINAQDYVVQLAAVRNRKTLEDFVANNELRGLLTLRIESDGNLLHVLLLGTDYADRKQAQAAIDNLPAEFAPFNPWIRSVGSLRNASRSAEDSHGT